MKIFRLLITAVLLTVAALTVGCGSTTVKNMSTQEILQNAIQKMDSTKGFHFTLDKVGSINVLSFSFDIRQVEGDVVEPDSLQAKVNAVLMNSLVNLTVVNVGSRTFLSNPLSPGKWMDLSGKDNPMGFLDPSGGVVTILKELQDPKQIGTEKVGGTECYHLRGVTKAQAKKALLGGYSGDEDITSDVWIGAQDFDVRKMTFSGSFLKGEPKTMVRNLTLSKFDQTVEIKPPMP